MLQNNRNNNTIYIYFIICLLYVYLFILLLRVDLIETAISASTTAPTTEKQNNNKILQNIGEKTLQR